MRSDTYTILPKIEDAFLDTANRLMVENDTVQMSYIEQSEKTLGEISIDVKSEVLSLQTFRYSCTIDKQQLFEMQSLYNVDMVSQAYSTLNTEELVNTQKLLLSYYQDLGDIHRSLSYSKYEKFLEKYLKVNLNKKYLNYKTISTYILNIHNLLNVTSRIGGATFCVLSQHAFTELASHSKELIFTKNETGLLNNISSIRLVGSIRGVDLFISPYAKDEIVMGKYTRPDSIGLYLVEKDRIASHLDNVMCDYKPTETLMIESVKTIKPIGVNAKKYYWSAKIYFKRKHFWRTLLNV